VILCNLDVHDIEFYFITFVFQKMKRCRLLLFMGFGLAGSIAAIGQTSGTASALLVTPITIVKNVDMKFGNVAVSSSTSGTVVLSPSGLRSTGGAGGVTLPATTGTVSAADFTVYGQAGYAYSVTLPVSAIINDGSGHTITINNFTSNPSTTGTISTLGSQDLTVGATLNVAAGQVPGTYTNSTAVPVTVNYY
jgi:phage-related minor tail protein